MLLNKLINVLFTHKIFSDYTLHSFCLQCCSHWWDKTGRECLWLILILIIKKNDLERGNEAPKIIIKIYKC